MRRVIVLAVVACVLVTSAAHAEEEVVVNAPDTEKPPSRSTFSAMIAGGASYRALFGLPVETGFASLALGSQSRDVAFYVHGDYEGGNVDRGLAVRVIRVGPSLSGVVGRFRIGVGVDLSDVAFVRATNGASIDRFGIGMFATTSYDLVRFDDRALFLGARGDLDLSAHMYGGALMLGFRL